MLKNSSIKMRLAVGFSGVLIVLGTLVIVTFAQFANTREVSELIAGRLSNQIRTADALGTAFDRQRTALRGYALGGQKNLLLEYANADKDEKLLLISLRKSTEDAGGDEKAAMAGIDRRLPELDQAERRLIELVAAGKKDEAFDYHQSTLQPVAEDLFTQTGRIAAMGHQHVVDMSSELRKEEARTTLFIWALFVLGLLTAASFALATITSITKPAKAIAEAAAAISRGDYAGASGIEKAAGFDQSELRGNSSRNELRHIGLTVSKMAAILQRRERSLTAQARIASVCTSTTELGDLSRLSLAELAEHTSSQAGAVYVEGRMGLECCATFGMSEEAATEALTGTDGLVTQAINSGKPSIIENIPEDTVFSVKPGLGEIIPKAIACIPLSAESKTVGAVVLASVYGYDEAAISLMKTASDEIAVAFANSLRYIDLTELAAALQKAKSQLDLQNENLQAQNEELQAQSEEIQTQSEEIAAQNEELAAQAGEMQNQNDQLKQTTKDLSSLQSITAVALSTLDPVKLAERLLNAACDALDLHFGMVMLLDDDGVTLRSRVWRNLDIPDPDAWALPVGEGFAGAVAKRMEILALANAQNDLQFTNPHFREAGVKGIIGVPLMVEGRVFGVALLGSPEPREFDDREKRLLGVFGLRTAVAIDRARSYQELGKAERENRVERERLQTIIDNIPEAVVIAGAPEGRLINANKAAMMLMGIDQLLEAGAHEYSSAYGVFAPDGSEMPSEDLPLSRSVLKGESCERVELLLRHHDGTEVPVAVNSCPILDDDGRVGSAVAVFQDISAEKEEQRVLQEGLQHQTTIAHELQQALLPSATPRVAGLEIAEAYRPATLNVEVGGDFYDILDMGDGKLGIVMADVSGKGVRAAVYTAMAKYMLHAFSHENPEPADVLRRLNDALVRYVKREVFITLFYGIIDTRTGSLTYANAGHEEPIIFDPENREITILIGTGPALGVIAGADYSQEQITVPAGHMLIMYTDGVTEARRDNETYGPDRLAELVKTSHCVSAQDMVAHILEEVWKYSDGNQRDDVAVLVLKTAELGKTS